MNDKPSRDLIVFAAALALPAEQRAAYLALECGDDHALKAHIEALMRDDSEAGKFMEAPLGASGSLKVHLVGGKPGGPHRPIQAASADWRRWVRRGVHGGTEGTR